MFPVFTGSKLRGEQRLNILDRAKSAEFFREVDELVKLFTTIKSRMKEKLKT
jgi:hypothetical protein